MSTKQNMPVPKTEKKTVIFNRKKFKSNENDFEMLGHKGWDA